MTWKVGTTSALQVPAGEGNILLGGGGNDVLEGRGGNDVLDGDRYLNVRLSVRTDPNNPASEIGSATSMNAPYQRNSAGDLVGTSLQQAVFTGAVDPGNIIMLREILTSAKGDDTAVFSDVESNYTITTTGGDGTVGSPGSVTTVQHNNGEDGTDTLHNIEHLIFGSGTDDGDDDGQAGGENGEDGQAGEENEGTGEVTTDGVEVIPGDGEVTVVTPPAPGPGPVVDPAPAEAVPGAAPDPAPAGFVIRIVDSAGAQVGEIRTTELGATRTVVRGLDNGTAYRVQVAPTSEGSEPAFSGFSEPVTPRAPEDRRSALDDGGTLPLPQTDHQQATELGPSTFGMMPPNTFAALAQYVSTGPGTAVFAAVVGALTLTACFLSHKRHRSRVNARKPSST